jgi:hypothetical protein
VDNSSPQAELVEVKLVMVEQEPTLAKPDVLAIKVLRIHPNPRLVLCAYSDGGLERRALVRVGRNGNFARGMEFEAKARPKAWRAIGIRREAATLQGTMVILLRLV